MRLNQEEIREAISVEDGDEVINSEKKSEIEIILSRCGSLVRVSYDKSSVELAHFTVAGYL